MSPETLLGLAREALLIMILASVPPIAASLLVGLAMSALQTMTQLSEPSLVVVPKLAAAVLALIVSGPWIAAQLARFAAQILGAVAAVAL